MAMPRLIDQLMVIEGVGSQVSDLDLPPTQPPAIFSVAQAPWDNVGQLGHRISSLSL